MGNASEEYEELQRTKPPFRADHVGSLLRPAALKDARARHAKKEITDAQLKEIEDREIEKAIRKQEDIGLKLATDGEFRRSWWQFDFYKGLKGVELYSTKEGIHFAGVDTKADLAVLQLERNPVWLFAVASTKLLKGISPMALPISALSSAT